MLVPDTLAKLVSLQSLDKELVKLEAEAKAQPGWMAARERNYLEAKAVVEQIEAKIREKELLIKQKELDIASREEQMAKIEVQLNAVKTNRDFDTFKHQIEGLRADNSLVEDEVLALMTEVEETRRGMGPEKETLAAAKKEYDEGKAEAQTTFAEMQKKVQNHRSLRDHKAEEIPPEALHLYNKILGARSGSGISSVIDQTCQGCFMEITMHELTLVKKSDSLIQCKFCNRILYLPEDISV